MKVHFLGTRGSIPTAPSSTVIREKVVATLLAARGKDLRSETQIREFVKKQLPFQYGHSYGGNTPCLNIETGSEDYLIMDGGSGIRALGKEIVESGVSGKTFHIFFSHLHYDHVQGIPFFAPAYIPGNKVVFHGGHDTIEQALKDQMKTPFFPIPFETFAADISFETHVPGDVITICDVTITLHEQNHPGVSYGYRVDQGDRSFVYSTDAEHTSPAHGKEYPFIDFIKGTNLLIFDAPYTHSQSIGNREHWGHSSNIMGVELAARGEVGTLAIFHHDPASSDKDMDDFLSHTKKFLDRSKLAVRETRPGIPGAPSPRAHPSEVLVAYDGLIFEV
jgi:phosphoribosyl 1,2-cyclic phosphodiesterase